MCKVRQPDFTNTKVAMPGVGEVEATVAETVTVEPLATVAAGDDEGVTRSIFDVGPQLATVEDGPEPSVREMVRSFYNRHAIPDPDKATDEYLSALLSQGEGKARHEGWTEKGHEWLDAGAPLASSRSQHEGAE
jgi:hypothetical protein